MIQEAKSILLTQENIGSNGLNIFLFYFLGLNFDICVVVVNMKWFNETSGFIGGSTELTVFEWMSNIVSVGSVESKVACTQPEHYHYPAWWGGTLAQTYKHVSSRDGYSYVF